MRRTDGDGRVCYWPPPAMAALAPALARADEDWGSRETGTRETDLSSSWHGPGVPCTRWCRRPGIGRYLAVLSRRTIRDAQPQPATTNANRCCGYGCRDRCGCGSRNARCQRGCSRSRRGQHDGPPRRLSIRHLAPGSQQSTQLIKRFCREMELLATQKFKIGTISQQGAKADQFGIGDTQSGLSVWPA